MRTRFPRRMKWDLLWVIFFFLVVLGIENFLVLLWAGSVAGQTIASTSLPYSCKGVYSIAMLCSGAASFVAGLIGFLFGIPQSTSVRSTRTEVSTPGSGGDATAPAQPADVQATPQTGGDAGRDATAPEQPAGDRAVPQTGGDAAQRSGLHRNTNLESISDALTKGLLAIGATQLYKVGDLISGIDPAFYESFGPGSAGQIVALSVMSYGAIEGFLFGYLATRIYLTGVFERNDPPPS
jgi:hypothetical protein